MANYWIATEMRSLMGSETWDSLLTIGPRIVHSRFEETAINSAQTARDVLTEIGEMALHIRAGCLHRLPAVALHERVRFSP